VLAAAGTTSARQVFPAAALADNFYDSSRQAPVVFDMGNPLLGKAAGPIGVKLCIVDVAGKARVATLSVAEVMGEACLKMIAKGPVNGVFTMDECEKLEEEEKLAGQERGCFGRRGSAAGGRPRAPTGSSCT